MQIRSESPGDIAAISALITAAFAEAEHSSGTEAQIVERLRGDDALILSLVAIADGEVTGHIAFSSVSIGGKDAGWVGLGPVSVSPERQRQGIGAALIREGLSRMHDTGRKGCVLLGDPGFYGRFGFRAEPRLTLPAVPPEYFLALPFDRNIPTGEVAYHPVFG